MLVFFKGGASTIIPQYHGESEKLVRKLFGMASDY
jgi:ATP-dependent 26S proteasome regulatory subunit